MQLNSPDVGRELTSSLQRHPVREVHQDNKPALFSGMAAAGVLRYGTHASGWGNPFVQSTSLASKRPRQADHVIEGIGSLFHVISSRRRMDTGAPHAAS